MKPHPVGDAPCTKLYRAMTETRKRLAEVDAGDTLSVVRLCIALDDLEFHAAAIRQDLQARRVA